MLAAEKSAVTTRGPEDGRISYSLSIFKEDKAKLIKLAAKMTLKTGQPQTPSSVVRMMIDEFDKKI